MSLDEIEDILFEFPELRDFVIGDLEDLDETELEDLIAEFDSIPLSESTENRIARIRQIESRVKSISSDSGIKALNSGTLSNSTDEVQFVTRRDNRVCTICEDLDGESFTIDPETRIINGPLIPDDLHPNCRCRYINIDGDELLLE